MDAKWHADRLKGLGGSDIAAALGVSPYKSQLELWGEKTGLSPSTFEGNEFTYWGTAIEPVLAKRFIEEHPEYALQRDELVCQSVHDEYEWGRANIDGMILDNDAEPLGIWEAKTASKEFTEVPVHYQLQVQHYMWVYDLPFAIISVLFHGNNYQEFRIERDEAYLNDLVPELENFWDKVQKKLPVFLPIKSEDFPILIAHGGEPDKVMEVDGGEFAMLIAHIQEHTETVVKHKAAADQMKKKLMALMIAADIKVLKENGKAMATLVSVADSPSFDMVRFKKECQSMHKQYLTKTRKGYTSLRVAK